MCSLAVVAAVGPRRGGLEQDALPALAHRHGTCMCPGARCTGALTFQAPPGQGGVGACSRVISASR